jgi:glycosyltransferase involved in cell wall biosynthesis
MVCYQNVNQISPGFPGAMLQAHASKDNGMKADSETTPRIRPGELCPDPLVSVLVTNYNYARFLGKALDSVLNQTYTNFEIVICDDGSSDGSKQLLTSYADSDSRVKVIFRPNGGQPAAMNDAFGRSTGEVVCLLDADDLFEPGKLERVIEKFRSDGTLGIVGNSVKVIDANGGFIRTITYSEEGYLGPSIYRLRKKNITPPCSGLSFRRQVLNEIFPLPVVLRIAADGAIIGPAVNLTSMGIIREPLSSWRIHGENNAADGGSLPRLSPEWLERNLRHSEALHRHIGDFVSQKLGVTYRTSDFRPIIEYRLALGILRRDKVMARRAFAALLKAYPARADNYSYFRLIFWKSLLHLHSAVAIPALKAAYQIQKRYSLFKQRISSEGI